MNVKRSSGELGTILEHIVTRSQAQRGTAVGAAAPFAEITDDDIDALFN
jgi:hypothetical protein